jgi:prepilin peptidase CpaA
MLLLVLIAHALLLVVTVVAAVIDWRTGHIPDWLTLPLLLVGPAFWLFVDLKLTGELYWFWLSLAGIPACGLVPYIIFRKNGMGGGDVKLFMAIGALGTVSFGIEAQFLAFIAGAVFSLGRLAWRGRLFATLGNAFYLGVNPVLPKKYRREISEENMSTFRMGSAIAMGTAVAMVLAFDRLRLWA